MSGEIRRYNDDKKEIRISGAGQQSKAFYRAVEEAYGRIAVPAP